MKLKRTILAAVLAASSIGMLTVARSNSSSPSATAATQQIKAAEQERCEAITHGDAQKLGELLADDYVHVHGTGRVDTKQGFIANIVEHPRRTERGDLTVRVYGPVAVITGEQYNYMQGADAAAAPNRTTNLVTQVVRYSGGRWRFESFQLTPVAHAP